MCNGGTVTYQCTGGNVSRGTFFGENDVVSFSSGDESSLRTFWHCPVRFEKIHLLLNKTLHFRYFYFCEVRANAHRLN